MPTHRPTPPADASELGLERLVFFSDAVMAIAITLLAIDLRVPDLAPAVATVELPARLAEMGPRFMSFLVSFMVIGVYWRSHHRYFNYIKRYDGVLVTLNMLFLLCIVLMPFVSGLLGQYPQVPLAWAAYAAAVGLTGLSLGSVWWYATYHRRLVDADLDASFIRGRSLVALTGPAIFLASIPVALVSIWGAMAMWWLSPLVSLVALRLSQRRDRRPAHHRA